jgi:Xaa-Pro aminopeptidase
MKAVKNEAELRGMRACHYRDGAAESEFLAWLEEELAGRPADRPITEVELDEQVSSD